MGKANFVKRLGGSRFSPAGFIPTPASAGTVNPYANPYPAAQYHFPPPSAPRFPLPGGGQEEVRRNQESVSNVVLFAICTDTGEGSPVANIECLEEDVNMSSNARGK